MKQRSVRIRERDAKLQQQAFQHGIETAREAVLPQMIERAHVQFSRGLFVGAFVVAGAVGFVAMWAFWYGLLVVVL